MTHHDFQPQPLEQQETHEGFPGDCSWTLDISGLAPQEVVEVHRLITGPLESDLNDFGSGVRFPESCGIEAWEALHEVSKTHPVASQVDSRYDLERTPWNGDPNELRGQLLSKVSKLPDTDIERAKEVFSAFVNSPILEDRAMPLVCGYGTLVGLVRADHDYGVALWDQLIRDTDKRIRDAAETELERQLASGYEYPTGSRDIEKAINGFYKDKDPHGMRWLDDNMDDDALLNQSGLTRQDAYRLLESYAYAENGQYLRRLGSEALYKLIDSHVVPKRPTTS